MVGKAHIIGNIGKIESKKTKTGGDMVVASVATNKNYTDSNGERRQETTWHIVNFFGAIANNVAKFCTVGDQIYVEGEIKNREINDQNGKRWIYSITATEVKFLTPKSAKKSAPQVDSEFDDPIPF